MTLPDPPPFGDIIGSSPMASSRSIPRIAFSYLCSTTRLCWATEVCNRRSEPLLVTST